MTDTIQAIWANECADARPLTPEALRRRADELRRSTLLRDFAEYFAAGAVIATFSLYAIYAANLFIAGGSALVILGTLAVTIGLWQRRPSRATDVRADTHIAYLRAQLVRHRDAAASVARWYLAPVLPGLCVLQVGYWMEQAPQVGAVGATMAAVAVVILVTIVFSSIWWLNRRAALAYEQEIKALDRAQSSG